MIDKSKRYLRVLAAVASNPPVTRDVAGALLHGRFRNAKRMAHTAHLKPDLRAEKIISHRYRWLWICVPKVASRSLMHVLRCADPDAEVFVNKSVRDVYAMRPEARNYYSFAFVRYPFERALSFYRELHFAHTIYTGEQGFHKEEKRQSLFDQFYGLEETGSFEDLCLWLNTPYGSDALAEKHFLSQHIQINLRGEHKCLPDFVGRLENLDADMKRIADHLGMPAPALPMLNTMAGWETTPDALNTARSAAMEAHLTPRNKALLRTRYAEDFRMFGYSSD